jgi:hypothetical protein
MESLSLPFLPNVLSRPDSTCHLTNKLSKGLGLSWSCSGVPSYKVQSLESNTKLTMRAQGLSWGSHVFKVFSVYRFRYTSQLCHTGVETGRWWARGAVGIWPCTIRWLCHTGALRVMRDRCSRAASQVWSAVYYTAGLNA